MGASIVDTRNHETYWFAVVVLGCFLYSTNSTGLAFTHEAVVIETHHATKRRAVETALGHANVRVDRCERLPRLEKGAKAGIS